MLFNSIEFLIFLPTVFFLYWYVFNKKIGLQNAFILIISYVFYAWWDYRFLTLIMASTLVDFFVARAMEKAESKKWRKLLLIISLSFNLGLLGFFKYYNFFIESWMEMWSNMGIEMQSYTLQIILPVGISFYTFQTLSYTLDVYKKKIKATDSFINFAAYVAFFPQLVAGPIERASSLLPQFGKKRKIEEDNMIDGLGLIIWGLFKKIVIADSCAVYVNAIFDNYENLNSLTLILGAIYFAFQIYGDFSGYSDMAIGIARLLGFKLMRNFAYPYFSRDIAEFWRRWHISLSTWFRDYLYIPLGGSRGNKWFQLRNVLIIFLVSGFWHGANWTFIVWGALHALYFIPLLLMGRNRKYLDTVGENGVFPSLKEIAQMLLTFILSCIAWVVFRAETVADAWNYFIRMFSFNFNGNLDYLSSERYSVEAVPIIGLLVLIEWWSRNKEHPLKGRYYMTKIGLTLILILMLGVFSNTNDFIYFQF
ncbi:MBOAT family protein [Leptobacterium flavescens]|uniref:MBOAT family protein n=1 Tax=Leptobacterium flavescens TaxID=472055 RepID=A0A6P0UFZ5_9FLAO|nr:MBOAT family protein [Leptobacterium flavescens]NER12174.1 MBOAT family protein [Leptobacterium flavescens]